VDKEFLKKVRLQAELELKKEKFAKAVEQEKLRLMTKKPWWFRLFPFVITITRR
jgi:hypothetical protein